MADYKLWNALNDAKKYRWVELSHSLNNESPYWSGIPEGSVELAKTVWDWGKPELECLIQTFKFPGQFGTHIDFPGHFIKGKALSEKFDVNDLIFPLVVIDISQQAKKDPRYAVTVEDIKAYEAKYGPIPDGALVALRSDWYKKWPDMDALSGIDAEGKENAPGWSLEALEYIYKVRTGAGHQLHPRRRHCGRARCAVLRPRRGRDAEPQRGQPRRLCRRCRTGSALYCCAGPRLLHDDRPAAR